MKNLYLTLALFFGALLCYGSGHAMGKLHADEWYAAHKKADCPLIPCTFVKSITLGTEMVIQCAPQPQGDK